MKIINVWIASTIIAFSGFAVRGADKFEVMGPENHAILDVVRGGAFFIPADVYRQRAELQEDIELLQRRVDRKQIDQATFDNEIKALEQLKEEIDKTVERTKVFAPYGKLFSQTDTYEFELGKDACIAVITDSITIESWEGKTIRCVMEKTILTDEKPTADQFDAIRVEHNLEVNTELFGQTEAQASQKLNEFLASAEAKSMSDDSIRFRKSIVEGNIQAHLPYESIQGKQVNILRVKGLVAAEGNQHLSYVVKAPFDNQASHGGEWARAAKVTIQIPKCNTVAALGPLVKLHIKSVIGNFIVTDDGSHDVDYQGSWIIENVQGNVLVSDVPVQTIRGIQGNVRLENKGVMRDSSTMHRDDQRHLRSQNNLRHTIEDIQGDVTAHCLHSDLQLRKVSGTIDVMNEFGRTEWRLEKKPTSTVSLRSQSGETLLLGDPSYLAESELVAMTQCGEVIVHSLRKELEEKMFSFAGNSWKGFASKPTDPKEQHSWFFTIAQKIDDIWNGTQKPDGIFVINRAGIIRIEPK